ncbi:OmpP1/FadL family transporter [uncultured Mucilaginibacter sp.]|uniref:OmpP1/FadL family transporter n=1 Tax=uncultured Mucilaginibacter sp. TaxID=797541 RepID=UPI0025D0FEF3|nr:outer membrane protein transport protein [uncultured Mucilaginibacter sp.]
MKKYLLLVLALMPVLVFAQGFQVNLEGEKQIGMGHTGTGTLQDGASVFFNPGAVAMLPENYVQAGISPLSFMSEFNPTNSNATFRTANKIATPFTFYGVWGPKNSFWKFGLGIYTPFGGLTDWGDTWQGKYALESLDLKTIFFQPTLSVKLTDYLSIGAGFVYNHADIDLHQAIPISNSAGADGQGHLSGTGKGYGWNAGIFFKTLSGVTIGLSHRSGVSTSFNGNAMFSVAPSVQGNFPSPNTFTSKVPLPSTNSVGIGLYPSPNWTIAIDANEVNWDVFKNLSFTYAQKSTAINTTVLPQNYQQAYTLRAGAEYRGCPKLALRFGGGYATAAAPADFVSPQVPDANRVYFTGGIGYKIASHLNVDASFEFEHLMARQTTNAYTQLSGTYETNVYIPGISLSYHW